MLESNKHNRHICACSVTQSCLTLSDPVDYSPPGPSVHGSLQARILEWVAMLFSRGSSQPRGRPWVSCISCLAGKLFATKSREKPPKWHNRGYSLFMCHLQSLDHKALIEGLLLSMSMRSPCPSIMRKYQFLEAE